MTTRVVEQVDDWDQQSFGGGYRELHALSDDDFSGVVRADGAELFMTRGTVVGIRSGSIDAFEGASGTTYEAPTDALPLLAVMQDRSDEVRAKYYTEDTAISEVDRTLEDGNFTGYVELSENVLSGDYYLVYHKGHSMAVAYVGSAGRLLTDDEAFDRADGEVGIYEVRPVDIDPIEIPEPTEPVDEEPTPDAATAADDASDVSGATQHEASGADQPDATDTGQPEPAESDPSEAAAAGQQSAASDAASADSADDSAGGLDRETVVEGEDDEHTEPERTVEADERAEQASSESATETVTADEETNTTPTDSGTDEWSDRERAPESTGGESDEGSAVDDEPTRASPNDDPLEEPEDDRSTDDTRPGGRDRSTDESAASAAAEMDSRSAGTSDSRQRREPTTDERDTGGTASRGEQAEAETLGSASGDTGGDASRTASGGATAEQSPPEPDDNQGGTSTTEQAQTHDATRQLETRSIPSLDPERTSTDGQSNDQPRRDAPGRPQSTQAPAEQSTQQRQSQSSTAQQSSPAQQSPQQHQQSQADPQSSQRGDDQNQAGTSATAASAASGTQESPADAEAGTDSDADSEGASERIEELQDLLDERETEIQRLESELESAESERESLQRELEQVRDERDELQAEVESLEEELSRLEEELGAATNAQQRMTPQEALSGTDIFVRYRSKGDATLEKAHGGSGFQEDVVENLRLEKHTQFDAETAAVGGREYDEFLEDTVAYRFVQWVVEELLFEIQSTGHTEALQDLYDALPQINRIELNGSVTVTYTEDGQETETTESFDVVFRERMGDPLLVANINDSRQGATESMMEGLITSAERVGQTTDQFASAFLVTESFFEPEALETVSEATRGGLLSRDKRKSFVNLSRKRGYHLCLVEARNQNFHLEVPEL